MASRSSSWCGPLLIAGSGLALAFVIGLHTEQVSLEASSRTQEPFRLTILHTNDIHGRVKPSREGRKPNGLVPLGRAIRQARDRARGAGEAAILLDAGDFFQGTPEGNLTLGGVVVAWMNELDYDALTVGDHDFDYGIEVPAQLAKQASFPFLGANVREERTGGTPSWLGRGSEGGLRGKAVVRSFGPLGAQVDVAIVGVTTSQLKELTVKDMTKGLSFLDEVKTVERVLGQLPRVDLVVLLTHCGLEGDRILAQRFQGRVDVIVGGHSHTRLDEGERVGKVLIAQAHFGSKVVGRVRVSLSRGSGATRVSAVADLLPAGDDLDATLAPFFDRVDQE